MNEFKKALKAAFPHTIPILTGFLFIGMVYGMLMNSKGYGPGWVFLFSAIVLAGSGQFLGVTFLTSAFNPLYALVMTLIINARHLFYGISFLDRYRDTGRMKPYLIYGLCDETFSVICASQPPEEVSPKWFYFSVTALHQVYWVTGGVLGGLIGAMVSFDTRGLDFVLTALFTVIFTGQWKSTPNHKPALIGLGSASLCLILLGPDRFILPSMLAIILLLIVFRSKIQGPAPEKTPPEPPQAPSPASGGEEENISCR